MESVRMNEFEEPVDNARLCYYCSAPATIERSVRLTSEYADGVDIFERIRGAEPIRGAIRVVADVCDAHENALSDAMLDATGAGALAGQSLTRSTCPDAFHTASGDRAQWATKPTPLGGDVWESHYECPTCGFSTMQMTVSPPDIPEDAYVFAFEAMTKPHRPASV